MFVLEKSKTNAVFDLAAGRVPMGITMDVWSMYTSSAELPLWRVKLLLLWKLWYCSAKVRPGHIQIFLTLFNQLNLEGELIKDVQSFSPIFIINAPVTQFFRWNLQWKGRKQAFQTKYLCTQDEKQMRSHLGKLTYLPIYCVLRNYF